VPLTISFSFFFSLLLLLCSLLLLHLRCNIHSSFSFTIHYFPSPPLLIGFSYGFVSSIGKVFFVAITSLFHWCTAVFIGPPLFFFAAASRRRCRKSSFPFTTVLPSRTRLVVFLIFFSIINFYIFYLLSFVFISNLYLYYVSC